MGDQGADGGIILKEVFEKYVVTVWSGFDCLTIQWWASVTTDELRMLTFGEFLNSMMLKEDSV
jgi:hypothetical protein